MSKTKGFLFTAGIALATAFTLSCNEKEVKDKPSSAQIGGVYKFGSAGDGPSGMVYIYPDTDSTALFYLDKTNGAPSYNGGTLDGRITIRSGKAVFRSSEEYSADCVLRFEFNGDKLTVKQEGDCPFGYGVYIDDTFLRTSPEIPQYYINSPQGDTVYFSRQAATVAEPAEDETKYTLADSTLVIDETRFIVIYPEREEGYEDETGDLGFYTGNALGKFRDIGIESIGVSAGEKERYLSFALDKGKSHVIDLKNEQSSALLYKKGKKPIPIDIGTELPVTSDLETISKYLGIKAVELMKRAGTTTGSFRDSRDGTYYGLVLIGKQIWMSKNLNYAAKGSKCYDNDENNCHRYGRLYDWDVVEDKPCPAGWHLSTDEEWQTLINYAGGYETAGKKLKATNGWNEGGNGTDEYGFSALPGGFGDDGGSFTEVGTNGYWWSFECGYPACGYDMSYHADWVGRLGETFCRSCFLPVRCVRD